MTNLPKFSTALLHPRYWLTWLGIGVLWLVVQLPYPVIYRLGCGLGKLALRFMKRRAKIVHRNLELCFPEMSEQERRKMVVKNFESVGMGLMETGMAWFWPDKRMARWSEVTGTGMEPVHTLVICLARLARSFTQSIVSVRLMTDRVPSVPPGMNSTSKFLGTSAIIIVG